RWGLPGDNKSNDSTCRCKEVYAGGDAGDVDPQPPGKTRTLSRRNALVTILLDGAEADKVVGSRKDDLQLTIEKHLRTRILQQPQCIIL
ncbi:hypothetical protein E2562_021710, partial [Oryza meyeriana var. granulata]